MLYCVACVAQQYPFVYYTPRDGLVNSRVRGIKQDSKGRMLFYTYGGLSVYDGVAFKNYRQQDGLAHELVNDIIEITPDSFLVAINAPALHTLVRGRISNHFTSDNFYPIINRFLKTPNGDLYFLTDEGLYTLVDNKFVKLPILDAQGLEIGYNLNHVTQWNQFLFIIPWNLPQKEKLFIFDLNKKALVGVLTEGRVTGTAVTASGEIWLSSGVGIRVIDKEALLKGVISLRTRSDAQFDTWKNAQLYVDPNGSIWLYRNDRILYIPLSGKSQTFSAHEGLNTMSLSAIFVDRENNKWMASDGNGIVKMPANNVEILDDLRPGTINHISTIQQQRDTTWLYNYADHAFYRIHNDELTAFSTDIAPAGVEYFYIVGDALYFTTGYTRLYRIKHKDQAASYKQPVQINLDSLGVQGFMPGLVDHNGVLIQGAWRDQKCHLLLLRNDTAHLSEQLSYGLDQIAVQRDGYLWVPTRDDHLRGYSLQPGSLSRSLSLEYNLTKEIEGMHPRSIAVDTLGNVWIGTRNKGIYVVRFDGAVIDSILHVTTLHGLTDNFPTNLYCDRQNHIWAGSWTGLDKITYQDGKVIIENITKSKNLFMGISRVLQVDDETVWAVTSNGEIMSISSPSHPSNSVEPSFLITALTVNDEIFDKKTPVFNYRLNNLSLSVAAPSFIDEKSIQYSYMLQGSGMSNWSQPSNNAHFNFINLSPGSYVLNLKAQFPAHIYPEQELQYAFTIRPPYWQTWWFISLVAIGLGVLLALILQAYYQRKLEKQKLILEKKQAIEKERTRIATDMHDDLGAGLSRIKFLSDTIGFKTQQQIPIEEEVEHIGLYADEMIDKMGEIVWALNEKYDSLSDLLSYTRAYSVKYLAEHGLRCKVDKIPRLDPIMVNGEFRRNIFLSVKETLHNIIKHAQASEVTIQFALNDRLCISIRDNGIGFDQSHILPFKNGVSNIKKRMTEIAGEAHIESTDGTCIILSAPLPV